MARIASVNCGSLIWQQTFTYDAFGNITKNSTLGIGLFQPGYSTTTNQLTSLPGVTPTYDTDGRLTYDGAYTYSWDADSKLHTVNTSPSTTATYDAFGRMVEKQVGSAYTQIVYSPLGGKLAVMSAQTLQKGFVPLPTGATAVYTASGLAYYRHTDHLGSSRLATTPGQALYSSTAYAPFGEPYDQTGTIDLSFTGDDQDSASGMYDTLFRKQMPVQGRWLTPDPAGLSAVDLSSPQTWNRYAYVANNPMNFVDTLGLQKNGPGQCNVGSGDPCPGTNGGVGGPGDPISGGWLLTIYTWTSPTLTYSPESIIYGLNDDGSVNYLDPLGVSGDNPVLSGGGWTATIISIQTGWGQLSPSMFAGGAANNTATVSAAPGAKQAYCNNKSNQAGLNTLLPGLGDSIYNYDNVDVTQKIASGALESFFGFGTAAGQAMSWTGKSDMALTNIRSITGIPKTLVSGGLKIAGGVATAITGAKALAAAQAEYKACMAYMNSD